MEGQYNENLERLRTAREIWDLDDRRWALRFELRDSPHYTAEQKKVVRAEIAELTRRIRELRASDGG
jgi:hypothetical protein